MSFAERKFDPFSLKFSDVEFSRERKVLFSGLSFVLAPGQMLWIQGDNGVGKTSILKLALQLWKPDNGIVKIMAKEKVSDASKMAAYLGHLDAFEHTLTAFEVIKFWGEIFGYEHPVEEALGFVGLGSTINSPISNLSAGQKRRLALARLKISNRPIWILDEPKAAMDKEGQALIETLLSSHIASGGAAMVATHDKTSPIGGHSRRLLLEAE